MKILMMTPRRADSCSFYRSGGITYDLQKKFNDCTIDVRQWDQIVLHWQLLIGYDLLMLQRPFEDDHVTIVQFMNRLKKPVWVDYDDNLLALPSDNPLYEVYNPKIRENIKTMLRISTVVSVSTEALKDCFSEYSKNIWVIPNAFNDFIFSKPEIKPVRAPLILWRGSNSHIKDVMSVLGSIDKATLEFKDFQFLFLGWFPWYIDDRGRSNIFKVAPMDIIVYHSEVLRMQPAVIMTPLVNTLMNRCKSNIAWIEASYFGAVCIAPDMTEWQRPGVLNYKNPEDFYTLLKAVINKEINIEEKRDESWKYIMSELRLSKVNIKRVELINSVL
jgi:hypothetical protein